MPAGEKAAMLHYFYLQTKKDSDMTQREEGTGGYRLRAMGY